MRNRTVSGVIGLALLAAGGATASLVAGPAPSVGGTLAVTTTFVPVADSWADSEDPSTNYGSATTLRVDGRPLRHVYLRFNLAGLTGSVSRATLRLFTTDQSTRGYQASSTSADWSEAGLTWLNAPPAGTLLGESGSFEANTWTSVDVSRLISSAGVYNIELTTVSENSKHFGSRESGANGPQLVVETTAPAPTTAPASTTTTVSSTTKPPATSTTTASTTTPSTTTTSATTTTSPPTTTAPATTTTAPATTTTAPATTTTAPATTTTASTTTTTTTASTTAPATTTTAPATTTSSTTTITSSTTTTTPTNPTDLPSPPPADLSGFPIRAAFFYPWFPEAWNQQGLSPFTRYLPSIGYYDSSDSATIQGQIRAMQYGRIQVGISSWWGVGHKTDARLPLLLNAASTIGSGFRWTTYYEKESLGDPSVAEIQSDLTYLRDHYGSDPSYLRIGGRFVVFVYAGPGDECGMVDRWKAANTVGAYLVMKVFAGYRTCASQPNGWHQYAPAVAEDSQQGASFSISPGFYKANETLPRLTRDLTRWNQNVRDMVASNAPWQLVTTFDEWGEGTSVESATEWTTPSAYGAYLDALHYNGQGIIVPPTTTTTTPTTTTTTPTTTATPTTTTTTTTQPPSGTDPVVAAAGDIACDPADGGFNGGLGTASVCNELATSALLLAGNYAKVLTLGDHQYENNTYSAFLQSFDPSWGRVKALIAPTLGNHEYQTAGAAGYFQYFGAAAHQASNGYYSFDVGTWHMISLNAECSPAGGCGAGSPQEQWLKADLAAHTNACVLAYWHQPRWSSGQHGSDAAYAAFWNDLYAANADIVLNGHDHDYERFAPQNPSGQLDTARGVREFVVGTGGKNHYAFTTVQPNSQVRNSDTYGILQLTLHPSGYDWRFVPVSGRPFSDSGSGGCH